MASTSICAFGQQHLPSVSGARVQVQVLDADGHPWGYTFDVFVDGSYFGDAVGNPYRHWFLRDAYAQGELPIYWRLLYAEEVHYP